MGRAGGGGGGGAGSLREKAGPLFKAAGQGGTHVLHLIYGYAPQLQRISLP